MTGPIEIRDPQLARDWVRQGLCLAAIQPFTGPQIARTLAWCMELVSEQWPLPPVGIVADLGRLLGRDGYDPFASRAHHASLLSANGKRFPWHARYEDYVVGKALADSSFERAAAALGRYRGRDADRATAFVIERVRRRANAPAVVLGLTALRELASESPETLLAQGYESFSVRPHEQLIPLYESWSLGCRQLGACLGGEDLFELEQGTVLLAYSRRLALRQTLALVDRWCRSVPPKPVVKSSRRRDVASRLLDDDQYPVGGFTSISNRGTIESLLHSQLAYMEPADAERPDMFDIKFLRDELLYYSRDENQFLRRRRTVAFALPADWSPLRAKAAGQNHQSSILVAATVTAVIRLLIAWLGDEAIVFKLVFRPVGHSNCDGEIELLQMALKDLVDHGSLSVERLTPMELHEAAEGWAQRSITQVIAVGNDYPAPHSHEADWLYVKLGATPTVSPLDDEVVAALDPAANANPWRAVVNQLAVTLVARG